MAEELGVRSAEWRRWARLRPRTPDLERLATDIELFEAQLKAVSVNGSGHSWIDASRSCLDSAKREWRARRPEAGWALLNAARRWEAFWASPERASSWASELRNESAHKLPDWRKETVVELLTPKGDAKISPEALYLAVLIRDDAMGNKFRAAAHLRHHMTVLSVILSVVLVGILVFASLSPLPLGVVDGLQAGSPLILLSVVLLGALGGGLSAIIPLPARWRGVRHPDRISDIPTTVVRPLIGAAAALGVYTLMRAGLLTVGSGGIGAIPAVAFLSGFSEKFFMSAIGSLEQTSRDVSHRK